MGPAFDPYYNWLGIPAAEQPPNHYRLLGLAPLESNPTVIEHAADRVMIHLRTFAAGPHGVDSQRLLNEVATARVCLLDAAKKARYDADLQARLATSVEPLPASGGARLPRAAPLPAEQTATPVSVLVDTPVIAVNRSAPNSLDAVSKSPRKPAAGRKPNEVSNPQAAAIINAVKIVMGGLGGLSMAILLVWVVWGVDALGLFGKKDDQSEAKNTANKANPEPAEQPVKPVDPATPGPTPRPVTPTPTDPTDPFQPVIDPTDPATPPGTSSPAASPPSTEPPSTKPKVKPKQKKKAPSNLAPAPRPVESPVEPPAPTPVTPNVAATPTDSRHPLPSEEAQKAKFDEFKSLYSKEFEEAERASAREKFPEFLISKADSIKSDPVARFAILRQAYTRLINARDFGLAVEIVDRLEQEYKVDELAMRVHTLTKATTAGRQTVAERQSLALCAADLAEVALRKQRIDHALTLARMAENLSKALQSKTFRERTITLKEEIEKAQASWGPVERARQTLAASPDDAAAALVDGRYRCLVAGDWATGLPVLAKGGGDPLAAAARLDQAGASDSSATTATAAAAIGDAWYDLAKSDDKLKPLYARALHWYRRAVADSTGAEQVPWLQRVEQIEGLALPERYFAAVSDPGVSAPLPSFVSMYFRNVAFEPYDCFKFIVPLELKASPWNVLSGSANAIYSKADIVYGKVPTHVPNIPREYQVGVRVSQYYSSTGPFVIGMVGPRGPFAVVVDMPISTEFCTFITLEGVKTPEQNPTLVRYPRQHLMFGDAPVLVQIRRNSVTVQIKNQEVTKFDGDLDKLVSPPEWTIPKFNGLLLGAHQGSYRVSSWFLEPVAPAPRLSPTGGLPAVPNLPNFPSSP